jgi:transcriptional regulator with XRE-family HTH domain
MITLLGKVLRKLRIDKNMLLADMAKKLNVSSAYLSSIELGKREIPQNFEDNICQSHIFTHHEIQTIKNAIDDTRKSFTISPINHNVRGIVAGFARNANDLSEEQIQKMFKIINSDDDE